jgi:hypothetical protein
MALVVGGYTLSAPATVHAQSADTATVLAAPAAGVAPRPDAAIDVPAGSHRLFVHSEEENNRVRVERLHAPPDTEHEWRCDTPCSLTLVPGAYRLWLSAEGLDEEFRLDANDVFVEGRPGSLIELTLGIGIGVAAVALLSYALLAGEGACFDLSKSCPTERGPLALGAGGFALALGIGLMFDSAGYVDVTSVRP